MHNLHNIMCITQACILCKVCKLIDQNCSKITQSQHFQGFNFFFLGGGAFKGRPLSWGQFRNRVIELCTITCLLKYAPLTSMLEISDPIIYQTIWQFCPNKQVLATLLQNFLYQFCTKSIQNNQDLKFSTESPQKCGKAL